MLDKPVGFESLIRLKGIDGEYISPDIFIPIAENSGLIRDVTDYLCDVIALEAAEINDIFIDSDIDPYININISPTQLKDIQPTISALKRAQNSGLKINVEIIESTILNDTEVDEQFNKLQMAGFSIAIDDFGTGYSSIQRLEKLKSSTLKVDQYFVRNIADPQAYSFLHAIINLAQTTSSRTIIEGVETLEQRVLLMQMGVRFCQGYLWGKPMYLGELERYLSKTYGFKRVNKNRFGHVGFM